MFPKGNYSKYRGNKKPTASGGAPGQIIIAGGLISQGGQNFMFSKRKKYWGVAVCVFVVISILLFAAGIGQGTEEVKECSMPDYERGCSFLMKGLHKQWIRRDGMLSFCAGEKMFWALMLDANAFYKEFSEDTANYTNFIDGLDKWTFWNFGDTTTAQLERLRIVSIERLMDLTYSVDSIYLPLHEDMIERLKQVKVGFVD